MNGTVEVTGSDAWSVDADTDVDGMGSMSFVSRSMDVTVTSSSVTLVDRMGTGVALPCSLHASGARVMFEPSAGVTDGTLRLDDSDDGFHLSQSELSMSSVAPLIFASVSGAITVYALMYGSNRILLPSCDIRYAARWKGQGALRVILTVICG